MNASYGGLQKVHVLSLCNKYSKKTKYDKPFPYVDAWVTVLAKQRPECDASLF